MQDTKYAYVCAQIPIHHQFHLVLHNDQQRSGNRSASIYLIGEHQHLSKNVQPRWLAWLRFLSVISIDVGIMQHLSNFTSISRVDRW